MLPLLGLAFLLVAGNLSACIDALAHGTGPGCPFGLDSSQTGTRETHSDSGLPEPARRSKREAVFLRSLSRPIFPPTNPLRTIFYRTAARERLRQGVQPYFSEPLFKDGCRTTFPYRTFEGDCNNLDDADLGKAKLPMRRLLPPLYGDGASALRTRNPVTGNRLPNPRLVSTTMHGHTRNLDGSHTLALMQWGQFLAHDVSITPKSTGPGDAKLKCDDCTRIQNLSSPCHPIPVPKGDPYYPSRDNITGNRTCIPFTRSAPKLYRRGHREQINAASSYVDASTIYGSDAAKSSALRSKEGGRLKIMEHPSSALFKPLMPRTSTDPECTSPTGECFLAGEERSNEQPSLTSMHTLFMREHNRLAEQISLMNPHWPDDIVFFEARKIVAAVNQHITYNEFLPRVLGPSLFSSFPGKPYSYDARCSSGIFNEFPTAAFRFGHSLIRSQFNVGERQSILLKDHFFNPDVLFEPQYVDRLMEWVLTVPMAAFDMEISKQLTNHLFEVPGRPFSGMDLAAINIQRGRDHGLQGYVEYLQTCTKRMFPEHEQASLIENLRTFEELGKVIGEERASKLSQVYRSVHDIDLFSGGLSEPSLPGGVVGMTFGCIIALQFEQLKQCDRFWYETDSTDIGFTPGQVQEVKKATLASIVCRNFDVTGVQKLQKNAFDLPDGYDNKPTDCSEGEHPSIDIEHWRADPFFVPEQELTSRAGLFRQPFGRTHAASSCDVRGKIVPVGRTARITACQLCSCSKSGTARCHSNLPEDCCDDLQANVGIAAMLADGTCREMPMCRDTFEGFNRLNVSDVPFVL